MASREELQLLRGARAGQADAQLALGKRYLFGSTGLPQSLPTAMHWLERAARQDCEEAWLLIGEHIPLEIAMQSPDRTSTSLWYERAFDLGSSRAGLTFARLILQDGKASDGLRDKAIGALEAAASAGLPDAQWLLAEHGARSSRLNGAARDSTFEWAERAAGNGVTNAQAALAEKAWDDGDHQTFMRWALPLARALSRQNGANPDSLSAQDARMLSRCAYVLSAADNADHEEVQTFWKLAAQRGDEDAIFRLGLWFARMDENGNRIPGRTGTANFKKAVRWLTQAGEQGSANAHYVLSRIYQKSEFSQRNPDEAQHCLERAAGMGHVLAQLECGTSLWKSRRENEDNDVLAAYWLQKAAAQGNSEAALLLHRIATRAMPTPWALAAQKQLTRDLVNSHPFLAARIELAAVFGLTRPEALLLDVRQADQDHCLLVDIRKLYGRSRRRLILIQTSQERQALSRIARLFEKVDCGLNGPEGNYRQRQYRLKNLLPAAYSNAGEEE